MHKCSANLLLSLLEKSLWPKLEVEEWCVILIWVTCDIDDNKDLIDEDDDDGGDDGSHDDEITMMIKSSMTKVHRLIYRIFMIHVKLN